MYNQENPFRGETKRFENVRLAILDVDKTLVQPAEPEYYRQLSSLVDTAISIHRNIDLEVARQIGNYYRDSLGGGEHALFVDPVNDPFIKYPSPGRDFKILYDLFCNIDPTGQFYPNVDTISALEKLKSLGISLVGLSNGADKLIIKELILSGIDPDRTFDRLVTFTPESGPPKIIYGQSVFKRIAEEAQVSLGNTLSVGDSYKHDIDPAIRLGMQACLVSDNRPEDFTGLSISSIEQLPGLIRLT